MIKDLFRYLGIEKFGWLEFIVALYPIMSGYGYGSFKLAFGVLLIIDILIIIKGHNKILKCLPLAVFCSSIILHDILFTLILPYVPSYFYNSLIATIIYTTSIFVIAPQINYNKFRSAVYVIALICMGGMVYHVMMLSSGQSISPIKLPFLPDMGSTSRLYAINERPTSFFWEPQSYASFMLAPLFFALDDRKIVYAVIIAALMIASTSTTGLILSILMFVLKLASRRNKWYTTLFTAMAVIVLVIFLVSSQYGIAGMEKLQRTDFEESNRVINGFLIAQKMNLSDFIFGIPFANVQDAYDAGYLGSQIIVHQDGVLFVSSIWTALIRYGIIGLVLFLLPYWGIYKRDSRVFPYLICIVVGHFTNPDFMGASYVFQIIVMLVFISRNSYTIQTRNYASPKSYISVR